VTAALEPFRIDVPREVLDDLAERLGRAIRAFFRGFRGRDPSSI